MQRNKTALLIAAEENKPAVAKLLITKKADLEATDEVLVQWSLCRPQSVYRWRVDRLHRDLKFDPGYQPFRLFIIII